MMHKTVRVLTGTLAAVLLLGTGQLAMAATVHYNDSSVTGTSAEWTAWVNSWEQTSADFTKVSLTPGKDTTQLNFAWYSKDEGKATPVVHFGTSKTALKPYTGTSAAVDASLTGDTAYVYNHATVTGLKGNTTYYYTVEKNGVQTAVETYKTGSFDNVKILFVGDPQIGASKGQTQNGEKLAVDSGSANTAARNDSFAWNRTLSTATAQNPDLNFIISAGDQVNKTGKPKEEEYAGYLSASVLTSLPEATTIGNHDSLNPDYSYHFNNPNATENGKTAAGGDYYYTYGAGLFIVLNTNNYNVAEHENTIAQAVATYPAAAWRIVTIHQDIYGSGLDHSDTDGMILRTQLTPIFDKYKIDVVLQGHDHTYSRSKLLYGDGQTHGIYEFQLNTAGTNYDWDNAYNTANHSKIPLSPDAADTNGTAALAAFSEDNKCYTIESTSGSTVTNPAGTLYMTANSASGSKFYELINPQQAYIAQRSQNWLPSYSIISMTGTSFSVVTYQITDAGKVEAIDQPFTIEKTGSAVSTTAVLTRGKTLERIYNAAGTPAVASSSFSDVSATSEYAKSVAWGKSMGLTKGYADGSFKPDQPITRAQLATLLYRYAGIQGVSTNVSGSAFAACTDAASVPAAVKPSLKFAMDAGLMTGTKVNASGSVTVKDADYALTKLANR